jgi:hypothetical protein
MIIKGNGTSSLDIDHALYLYFLGLSTRGISKAIFHLNKVKRRSHVAINPEVDSKVYTSEDINQKEKDLRIYHRRDID